MDIRLVLVGIEGGANLGMIMRLAENFEVDDVVLVYPRELDMDEARRFSAKAVGRLDNLVVYKNLDEALSPCDVRVCTTAKFSLDGDILRSTIPSYDLPSFLERYKKPCIVFGRESSGLTRDELSKCDFVSTIPSSSEYSALNLANSVSIYLYEIYKSKRKRDLVNLAEREELEQAVSIFGDIASMALGDETKIMRARTAMRHVLFRSSPSKPEVRILTHVLRRVKRRIEGSSTKQP
ncbi:RNA methyltransferase [Fervidicoccus fontis]|uniref:rRNA methylase n=2 Tax=Fervidicoccus fontis TaxID=683846 RepID=I0A294_FERFK|nr:TrmH family RNA methyltransferase [Fervidicoccus fontis]AFH43101.1 rRNA methylase [Fervidicoccus fontis Kam940]MBE9390481.1 RNA methyltransferase [Fervidicoccus fontis]